MPDALKLRFNADDDQTGELLAEVQVGKFSGAGSAWFSVGQLEEFATRLCAYPLPESAPVALEGGYWNKSGTAINQLHLGIRFYPIGSLGLIGCRVELATPEGPNDRVGSSARVAVELRTHYEQLGAFARSLQGLVTGDSDSVVLEGAV